MADAVADESDDSDEDDDGADFRVSLMDAVAGHALEYSDAAAEERGAYDQNQTGECSSDDGSDSDNGDEAADADESARRYDGRTCDTRRRTSTGRHGSSAQ